MFHFKQFSIEDNRCAMKVGTDAVLLGAWVNLNDLHRILDIGTGSALIALTLAQRSGNSTSIEAIESEETDAQQASKNVSASPWANRIKVFHQSLQKFESEKFDLIVSNPPYFINSQLPPATHRAKARHTNTLSYEELIYHSVRLMEKTSRLAVILPVEEGNLFRSIAQSHHLFCNRQLAFFSRANKPQERWLFEFSFHTSLPIKEKLVLHGAGEMWSEEYQVLTRDFYLKL